MTDRPILFSAPMITALLAGTKTQTRRALTKGNSDFGSAPKRYWEHGDFAAAYPDGMKLHVPCHKADCAECDHMGWTDTVHRLWPKYDFGDRLWVRETFSYPHNIKHRKPSETSADEAFWYWADGNPEFGDWTKGKPGIHMPRWASRITLAVTDVRVERLQDCSEADAMAEGVSWPEGRQAEYVRMWGYEQTARMAYADVWETINGPGSWEANPWVVAVTFTPERGSGGNG